MVPICMYRSIRAAGCQLHFECSVLSGPPAHGTMLQKIYIRTPADGSQRVNLYFKIGLDWPIWNEAKTTKQLKRFHHAAFVSWIDATSKDDKCHVMLYNLQHSILKHKQICQGKNALCPEIKILRKTRLMVSQHKITLMCLKIHTVTFLRFKQTQT